MSAVLSPWPSQTPQPTQTHTTRQKRKRAGDSPRQHQIKRASPTNIVPYQAEIASAKTECFVRASNDKLSCFPTSETKIPQHQWVTFVWNSRLPQYAQRDLVNIYLFHGESGARIEDWQNVPNPDDQTGTLSVVFDDKWLGNQTQASWTGQDIPWLFYFVVTPSDKSLEQSSIAQSTFTGIQTTYADSVVSSMSSSSVAAASSSRAAASLTAVPTPTPTPGGGQAGDGSVQGAAEPSQFPRWAIAVMVVLGFLAIVACCVLIFLIMRRLRRRNQAASNRGSMGSASPMMAHVENSPQSPLMAGAASGLGRRTSSVGPRPASVIGHDGASSVHSGGENAPFSGADAAIMANAFREALRKPDFAGRPIEEGESPETRERKEEMLSRELAEDGRDIRSVSSSRGVTVETLSDSGTVNDHYR